MVVARVEGLAGALELSLHCAPHTRARTSVRPTISVKLHWSLENYSSLYLVLDYVPFGTLFHLQSMRPTQVFKYQRTARACAHPTALRNARHAGQLSPLARVVVLTSPHPTPPNPHLTHT